MASPVYAILFLFLIPLGTTAPIERRPWATYALIGLNALIWLASLVDPGGMRQALALHFPPRPVQYASYAFLHDGSLFGFFHMAVNLFFFWLFARPLESRIGWWKLVLLYALAAAAGGWTHQEFSARAEQPLVGSSAAVYGAYGAFMILFPFSAVRCLFSFVVLVVPFIVRITEIPSMLFLLVMWGLMVVMMFVGIQFDLMIDVSRISTAAHIGGLAAGAGLAAALYGFHAFTPEAQEEQAEARRLERRLAEELRQKKLGGPAKPAGFALGKLRDVAPDTPALQPLHDAVMRGNADEALGLYRRLSIDEPDATLAPGPQMDLVRLLIRMRQHPLAIVALEALIKRFPAEEVADYARFELARQLIIEQRDPERAGVLLREFLKTNPPMDLEREAKTLLGMLPPSAAAERVAPPPLPVSRATGAHDIIAPAPDSAIEPAGTTAIFAREKPGGGTIRVKLLKETSPFEDLQFGELAEPASLPPDDTDAMRARATELFGDPRQLHGGDSIAPEITERLGAVENFHPENLAKPVPPGPADTGVLMSRAELLFGSPEDTNAMSPAAPPRPARPLPLQIVNANADVDFKVNIDQTDAQFVRQEAEPPTISLESIDRPGMLPPSIQIADQPSPDDASFPPTVQPSLRSKGVDLEFDRNKPGLGLRTQPAAAAPVVIQGISPADESATPAPPPEEEERGEEPPLARLAERPARKPAAPTPENHRPAPPQDEPPREALEYGVSTHFGDQHRSFRVLCGLAALEDSFDYNDVDHYAVILTPDRPVEFSVVVAVMGPLMNLSPEAAHHALLRRRGILSDHLPAREARELARELSSHGQSVTVVRMDEGLELREPHDVIRFEDQPPRGRFQTTTSFVTANWDESRVMAAGTVALAPGAPGRVVCDLVFGPRGPRLRLWENLYLFPRQVPRTVALQFKEVVASIAARAESAVHTRTLSAWLAGETTQPPHRFNSLIEYDNFIRWHVMAFHGIQKVYKTQ